MMTTRWDKPAVPLCEDDNPEILLKVEIDISLQCLGSGSVGSTLFWFPGS